MKKVDWLAVRRRIKWWVWDYYGRAPGQTSPLKTPWQKKEFEKAWDARVKAGKAKADTAGHGTR